MNCSGNCSPNQCRCHNELSLEKACIECLKADCVRVCQILSNDICSQNLNAASLNVVNGVANNLCVPNLLQANQANLNSASVNNLSAQTANLNNLCVNNLQVSNSVSNTRYRATMTYANNVTYTLGLPINWNTILDDPNNNVALSPNAQYTVPVSGYYHIFLQLDSNNLQGAIPILGTPVANLELLVNGVIFRQSYIPFLTFNNQQKATVGGLISLNAGDVVTSVYTVLVMGASGLTPYVGTVNILGTGSEEDGSVFKILLLSSNAAPGPVACSVNPPIVVACSAVSNPCQPLNGCPVPGSNPMPCNTRC